LHYIGWRMLEQIKKSDCGKSMIGTCLVEDVQPLWMDLLMLERFVQASTITTMIFL